MNWNVAEATERDDRSGNIVEFFKMRVKNEAKSRETGEDVFIEKEKISIRVPGDNTMELVRDVREEDKELYAKQYKAYMENELSTDNATQLEELRLDERIIGHLKYFNVFSVEQLARLSDQQCSSVGMGVRQFRTQAQKYLHDAEEGKKQAANKEMFDQLAALKAEIAALKGEPVSEDAEGAPARRGRKPKEKADEE